MKPLNSQNITYQALVPYFSLHESGNKIDLYVKDKTLSACSPLQKIHIIFLNSLDPDQGAPNWTLWSESELFENVIESCEFHN